MNTTGVVAGVFGSLVGMGGAFVMIPAMTGVLKFSQHQAHGPSSKVDPFMYKVDRNRSVYEGSSDLSLVFSIHACINADHHPIPCAPHTQARAWRRWWRRGAAGPFPTRRPRGQWTGR